MPRIDRHTRLVGLLKVVLPLAALALLATLFLFSDRIDPSGAIRYSEVDVEALANDPRMSAPTYAGITRDGTAITVTALAARPSSDNREAEADGVRARLDMPDGGFTEIAAARAQLSADQSQLNMSGGVRIDGSSGYAITTEALTTRLDQSGAESDQPVHATGPAGQLEAGRFSLHLDSGGDYLLLFSDRVKLIYQPGG